MYLLTVFWEENKWITICIKNTLNMAWNKQQDQKNISKYTDIVFVWGIDFTVFVHITSVKLNLWSQTLISALA